LTAILKGRAGKLALLGGRAVRRGAFPPYQSLGPEEKRAVMEVMDEGVLSDFIASPGEKFGGGKRVRRLEEAWAEKFGVRHAVAMNSATSGIFAAVGAVGVGAGDEVIVSPYNMSCSATCAFVYNAIPVFADLEPDCFCLDPESIRARLTPQTRAIVAVSSFGQAADFAAIMAIAAEHNLMVIDDAAHVAGALDRGRHAGTTAHVGIYSLNAHKTIQCGEGGIAVTDDDELALRLRLIRNHAEAVVGPMQVTNLVNMLGWNYRMTELEAAVAYEQLQKLERYNAARRQLAEHLTGRLRTIPGITPPKVREGCTHVYYTYPILYDEEVCGVPRARFLEAVVAEGVPFYARAAGYVKPYYLEPMFAQKVVYGNGCPFSCSAYKGSVEYKPGLCPVTERLYEKEMIMNTYCYPPLTTGDMDDIADAFEKVAENADALRQ
jgi:dTDP-4-amino-4,6-dideoxygalactose transaminase